MDLRVEFTAQLTFLYTVHLTVSILASVLLLIVLLMFRRFELFHSNLRTLLWHSLLCLLLNLYLQMIRILVPILQQFLGNDEPENGHQSENCFQFNEFPASICAFVCVSGFLLCVERLYATLRYVKYENESFEPFLTRICVGMWILLAFCTVWQFANGGGISSSDQLQNHSYFRCQVYLFHVNPLKTHWHILFAFLFYIVFCAVLYVILTLNRKKKEEYIEFYYSSLSQRFQIGENLKTVLLLTKIFPLTCLMFASILSLKASLWLYLREAENKNNFKQNILLTELSLLVVPLVNIFVVFAGHCFINYSFLNIIQLKMQINWPGIIGYVMAKFRAVFWRHKAANGALTNPSLAALHHCLCCGKLHNKNDTAMCEGDLLREYWDDYLHIQ